MAHISQVTASAHERQSVARLAINRAARALRSGLLAALQVALGTFVVGYPLLRLGFLGPAPEGHALETAIGIIAGAMALALFVLEGRKE